MARDAQLELPNEPPESEGETDEEDDDDRSRSSSSSYCEAASSSRSHADAVPVQAIQKVAVLVLMGSIEDRSHRVDAQVCDRLRRKVRSRLELCGVPKAVVSQGAIEVRAVPWSNAFSTAATTSVAGSVAEHRSPPQRALQNIVDFNATYFAPKQGSTDPSMPSEAAAEAHRLVECALEELAQAAGAAAPLVVVAHHLGGKQAVCLAHT